MFQTRILLTVGADMLRSRCISFDSLQST